MNKKYDYNHLINAILNNKELSQREKQEILEIIKSEQEKQYENEYKISSAKNWTGGTVVIGSTLIPVGTAARITYSGLKILKPLVKQIIINSIKRYSIEGALTGALYGIGKGIQEDKDILPFAEELAEDIIIGLTSGAAFGTFGGTVVTKFGSNAEKIKKLTDLLDKRNDWGIAFQKASGNPHLAIETLLKHQKGFVPDATHKNGIGNIDFVWGKKGKKGYGLAHIIEKRNKEGLNALNFINSLPSSIDNSFILNPKNQPNIKLLKNANKNAVIKSLWNDKKRNWLLSFFKDWETDTNRTPDIVSNYSEMTPSQTVLNNVDNKTTMNLPYSKNNFNLYIANIINKLLTFKILQSSGNNNTNVQNSEPVEQNFEFLPQQNSDTGSPQNGHWVTINGNHVFIEDK